MAAVYREDNRCLLTPQEYCSNCRHEATLSRIYRKDEGLIRRRRKFSRRTVRFHRSDRQVVFLPVVPMSWSAPPSSRSPTKI